MKVLIIRFSSIGDIVLTTPVIRRLKMQLDVEVHFITKKAFKAVLEHNPYIDHLHLMEGEIDELISELKAEKFDFIIDLHNNLRTARLKKKLGVPSAAFPKYNIEKWLYVNFKINRMPEMHIVDRYMKAAESLGIVDDNQGLDYFISDNDRKVVSDIPFEKPYIGLVIGGNHPGKMLPIEQLESLCGKMEHNIIVLGGPEDRKRGEYLESRFKGRVWNSAGKYKLNESVALLDECEVVITHDTGLMHVAAALHKKVISIWGATVPEFGMYPYRPAASVIIEPHNVWDRPYSKLGDNKWYKPNFKGMNKIDVQEIVTATEKLINSKV
jgi:ADP-heptose:LPS heptosyltransferase